MNGIHRPETITSLSLCEPEPGVLYTIERVAQFAGMPRRSIVLCARHGLVAPALDPAETGWCFNVEALRTLRRIEMLRAMHRLDVAGVKLLLELMSEIERLREEVRSSRGW